MQTEHHRAGQTDEMPFEALAMRGPVPAAATHRRAHHDRAMREAIVHVFELRGVVDPLIGSEREEVPKHDFDNRTMPCERQSIADADDGRFADRRIAHPPRIT